jgi:hypothetical protein
MDIKRLCDVVLDGCRALDFGVEGCGVVAETISALGKVQAPTSIFGQPSHLGIVISKPSSAKKKKVCFAC